MGGKSSPDYTGAAIQQGEANLFEEHVLTKLLEQRKAEWIKLIQKNLPAIEQKLEKLKPSKPLPVKRPPKPVPSPPANSDEYPSEILELLATQKPPPIPKSPQKKSSAWQADRATLKNPPFFTMKDILVVILLFGVFLGGIWYVRTSEESPPPVSTFDDQTQDTEQGQPSPEQLQIQTQFDAAAHELRFGQFEQGKAQLIDMLNTSPDSSYNQNVYLLLADTYRQRLDNPDEALRYYHMFTEQFPESQHTGLVRLKMGFTYEDMEDTTNAAEMYRLLIQHKGKQSRLGQLASERLSRLQNR